MKYATAVVLAAIGFLFVMLAEDAHGMDRCRLVACVKLTPPSAPPVLKPLPGKRPYAPPMPGQRRG